MLLVLLGAAPCAVAAPVDTLDAGVAALIVDAGKVPEKERLHRLFRLHARISRSARQTRCGSDAGVAADRLRSHRLARHLTPMSRVKIRPTAQ
jgi:hypothetical protein